MVVGLQLAFRRDVVKRALGYAVIPKAQLHVVEGADHSFHVLKRSGRTDEDVIHELAVTTRRFVEQLVA